MKYFISLVVFAFFLFFTGCQRDSVLVDQMQEEAQLAELSITKFMIGWNIQEKISLYKTC